jgi:hypothetical protein
MRAYLVGLVCAVGCAASSDGTPPVPTFSDGKADGSTTPACSLEWWSWLNNTYQPMLDRPATEVSADDLARAAASAPSMGETSHTYSLCYQGAVDKYVFAPAAMRLHAADVTYLDQSSPAYLSYSAYLANAAPTAEVTRNAAALAAIRPSAMDREAYATWMEAYSSELDEIVPPVAVPGPYGFIGDTAEPEWTFDAPDAAYASMLEAVRVPSNEDGGFEAWLDGYKHWLFTGHVSNSMVFNLDHKFGCTGVVLDANGWELPPLVTAFLDRFQATRPQALGDSDSTAWMSIYHGYMLRLIGDINNPDSYGLDDLMVQTLEQVMPEKLQSLFAYQTFVELVAFPEVYGDATLAARVELARPCVAAADLDAATASFTMATSGITASPDVIAGAAPVTCR